MKSAEEEVKNSDFKNGIRTRQWVGRLTLGGAALTLGGFAWVEFGPSCFFLKLTGLHCPGCGMTRAVRAVLRGEMSQAFWLNPLGMILMPLIGVGLVIEILGRVRGRPFPFRLAVGVRGVWCIAGIVMVFWILRNLPYWPFCLLAPT